MISSEKLFLRTIETLRSTTANATPDNLFDASAKLRLLLLDESPLLHQANSSVRHRVVFTVVGGPSFVEIIPEELRTSLVFAGGFDWFDPSSTPRAPTRELTLAQFLSLPMITIEDHVLTVRDLISYVANFAGAVHKLKPNTEKLKATEAMATHLRVGGMSPPLLALRSISRITIAACEPIYETLRGNLRKR